MIKQHTSEAKTETCVTLKRWVYKTTFGGKKYRKQVQNFSLVLDQVLKFMVNTPVVQNFPLSDEQILYRSLGKENVTKSKTTRSGL